MENAKISALIFLSIGGLAFSATGSSAVGSAVSDLNCSLQNMLPVVALLMMVAAGVFSVPGVASIVAYAIFKKEGGNKAKYSKWAAIIFGGIAVFMFVGAIMGILIVTVMPAVLASMYGVPAGPPASCP